MAVVTGVRNFVRLFGSTLALAIAGALANNALRAAIRPLNLPAAVEEALLNDPTSLNGALGATLTPAQRAAVVDGYARGFRHVFIMTVACQVIAALSAFFLIGVHNLTRADDKALKEQGRAMVQARAEAKKARKGPGDVEAGSRVLQKGTQATSDAPSELPSDDRLEVDEKAQS
jgi:hypothetical protein